jgi:hypothetical protein
MSSVFFGLRRVEGSLRGCTWSSQLLAAQPTQSESAYAKSLRHLRCTAKHTPSAYATYHAVPFYHLLPRFHDLKKRCSNIHRNLCEASPSPFYGLPDPPPHGSFFQSSTSAPAEGRVEFLSTGVTGPLGVQAGSLRYHGTMECLKF